MVTPQKIGNPSKICIYFDLVAPSGKIAPLEFSGTPSDLMVDLTILKPKTQILTWIQVFSDIL